MEKKENGVFRSKTGFTAVQNNIVRDKEISLKAKGLYLSIQSCITMPNTVWKKDDFFARCCEGEKAFESAWNELKEKGFLKTHMKIVEGHFSPEYELLDQKQIGPHTLYYNSRGELSSTNEDRKNISEEKKRYYPNGNNAEGDNDNGSDASGYIVNGGDNSNTNTNTNTNILTEDISNSKSTMTEKEPSSRVEHPYCIEKLTHVDGSKEGFDKVIDNLNYFYNLIKKDLDRKYNVDGVQKKAAEIIEKIENYSVKEWEKIIEQIIFFPPKEESKYGYFVKVFCKGVINLPKIEKQKKSEFEPLKKRDYDFDALLKAAKVN